MSVRSPEEWHLRELVQGCGGDGDTASGPAGGPRTGWECRSVALPEAAVLAQRVQWDKPTCFGRPHALAQDPSIPGGVIHASASLGHRQCQPSLHTGDRRHAVPFPWSLSPGPCNAGLRVITLTGHPPSSGATCKTPSFVCLCFLIPQGK